METYRIVAVFPCPEIRTRADIRTATGIYRRPVTTIPFSGDRRLCFIIIWQFEMYFTIFFNVIIIMILSRKIV